jgi:hypothetical protein
MFAALISAKTAKQTEVLSGVKRTTKVMGSSRGERLAPLRTDGVANRAAITILDGMGLTSCSTRERSNEVAMTMINKQPTRHKIEELLPWYATGTLSGREAKRVERALADDRELAQRYELVRRELAETTRLNEALTARAMEKLSAAINAEEARAPRPWPISEARFLACPRDSAREKPQPH